MVPTHIPVLTIFVSGLCPSYNIYEEKIKRFGNRTCFLLQVVTLWRSLFSSVRYKELNSISGVMKRCDLFRMSEDGQYCEYSRF